jgi:hypothetical protein
MKKTLGILLVIAVVAVALVLWQKSRPVAETKEQKILKASNEVLAALAAKDYAKLEALTSPDGLTLNSDPNLNFSASNTLTLPKAEVSKIPTDSKKHLFGYTDGKGDPINLTYAEYISKWIYNYDYTKAPQVLVNKTIGSGNTPNHIQENAGPNREFVVFYYPGFDPKYGGMDWTALYLVFDVVNGEYKLRGIAKANWTI